MYALSAASWRIAGRLAVATFSRVAAEEGCCYSNIGTPTEEKNSEVGGAGRGGDAHVVPLVSISAWRTAIMVLNWTTLAC